LPSQGLTSIAPGRCTGAVRSICAATRRPRALICPAPG